MPFPVRSVCVAVFYEFFAGSLSSTRTATPLARAAITAFCTSERLGRALHVPGSYGA
jgi:hypothetical protein